MLDLTDPKIALIHGALINVLANRDVEKIRDYFTEDAVLIINEKKLHGHGIYDRIQWLKDNIDIRSVVMNLRQVFFNDNQGFECHTSEVIYKNGQRALYKLFGYLKLRDQKICHYEVVAVQLAGEQSMGVVTATKSYT